ncbi:MAG: hypothetical protein PW734_07910 [Verrucomicrobium sp.]|nr:hypothetical protein [Verrucomicrobium sp.]
MKAIGWTNFALVAMATLLLGIQSSDAAQAVAGRTIYTGGFPNFYYTLNSTRTGPWDASYVGYSSSSGWVETIGAFVNNVNPGSYAGSTVHQVTSNGLLCWEVSTSASFGSQLVPSDGYVWMWLDLNDLTENTTSTTPPLGSLACALTGQEKVALNWKTE